MLLRRTLVLWASAALSAAFFALLVATHSLEKRRLGALYTKVRVRAPTISDAQFLDMFATRDAAAERAVCAAFAEAGVANGTRAGYVLAASEARYAWNGTQSIARDQYSWAADGVCGLVWRGYVVRSSAERSAREIYAARRNQFVVLAPAVCRNRDARAQQGAGPATALVLWGVGAAWEGVQALVLWATRRGARYEWRAYMVIFWSVGVFGAVFDAAAVMYYAGVVDRAARYADREVAIVNSHFAQWGIVAERPAGYAVMAYLPVVFGVLHFLAAHVGVHAVWASKDPAQPEIPAWTNIKLTFFARGLQHVPAEHRRYV